MLYTRIPTERVGVLIGPGGETKSRIQEQTGIILVIDSGTGEVTGGESKATDAFLALKVRDIVVAIGRGFSEVRAFRLFDDDTYLEVLDIKDFAHSRNRIGQIKARMIGTRGTTRPILEELTNVAVSGHGPPAGYPGRAVPHPR